MEHNESTQQNPQPDQLQDAQPQEPREWQEPAFERMTLKQALTGTFSPYQFDGFYNYDLYYS
jgi:hypothetical protein